MAPQSPSRRRALRRHGNAPSARWRREWGTASPNWRRTTAGRFSWARSREAAAQSHSRLLPGAASGISCRPSSAPHNTKTDRQCICVRFVRPSAVDSKGSRSFACRISRARYRQSDAHRLVLRSSCDVCGPRRTVMILRGADRRRFLECAA